MKAFTKHENTVHAAPGLEWIILKKLPLTLLIGTLLPLVMTLSNRLFPPTGDIDQVAKQIMMVDFLAIACVITLWAAVLTVTIGCVVVVVTKGPAYVADAYELEDSDYPRS